MEYPSDERLELAAISAETWKEHGAHFCQRDYFNEDGFG